MLLLQPAPKLNRRPDEDFYTEGTKLRNLQASTPGKSRHYKNIDLNCNFTIDRGQESRKVTSHSENLNADKSEGSLRQILEKIWNPSGQTVPDSSFGKAFQIGWQTFLVATSQILTAAALSVFGTKVGNPAGESIAAELFKNPATSFLLVGLMAPLLEESIFRGIPQLIRKGIDKAVGIDLNWPIGIASSLLFALAHNVGTGVSALQHFPLPQLVCGLFFWSTYNKYGLKGAIFAHACLNTALLGTTFLLGG